MRGIKVWLYPVRAPVDFVAAVAVRRRWPHFHLTFDVELLMELLVSLRSPSDSFVMLLRPGAKEQAVSAFLRERGIKYRMK